MTGNEKDFENPQLMIDLLTSQRDKAKLERDSAREKIAKLKTQVHTISLELDAARDKIARIVAGFEGCCMTCEPVGVQNQQMDREIAMLKIERDEARREVCGWEHHWDKTSSEQYYADKRGWDCFKEDGK